MMRNEIQSKKKSLKTNYTSFMVYKSDQERTLLVE